jgi:Tfp pilus assembly major pilin PilA
VGDQSLERFRAEYDKLHAALKKSHESEKRLIKKCRELNQEIVANAAKVHTALKLSQEDQNTIASLKREIEKVNTRAIALIALPLHCWGPCSCGFDAGFVKRRRTARRMAA